MTRAGRAILTCALFLPIGATILSAALFLGLLMLNEASHTSPAWYWDFWRSFGLLWALPVTLMLALAALLLRHRDIPTQTIGLIASGLLCGSLCVWLLPLVGWLWNGNFSDVQTIWLPASGLGAVAGAFTGWAFALAAQAFWEQSLRR